MKLERLIEPGLPPLAWLFQPLGEGEGRLFYGPAVWAHDDGFLEGCLGNQPDTDPSDATNVFGSALCRRRNSWLFVTPSHTLESLYFYRHAGGWSASNSLAFLAALHGIEPPWDPHYGAKFASICLGLERYDKTLWRTGQGEMIRVSHDNVELTFSGELRLIPKVLPPPFRSFGQYAEHLRESLELAFRSAAAPARDVAYNPLTTCSSGYDSACAASLAARVGCHEGVTLRRSREGREDSGKPLGELLGLSISEVDRPMSVEGNFDELSDFVATGMGGEDYAFKGFAPHVRNRILVTGFHGGRIWSLKKAPNPAIARSDLSGSSLQEFRLWNNFIHIPLPMIGARRHPEIAAISHSPEMAPYRLNNDYDRPIPRRIVEEAGVPRSQFGQQKNAASMPLFLGSRLLGAANRRECEAAVPQPLVKAAKYSWERASWEVRSHACVLLNRFGRRIPRRWRLQRALVGDWRVFEHSSPWAALEFLAGLRVVRHRYRNVLNARSRAIGVPVSAAW
jgi:hypothetical protein